MLSIGQQKATAPHAGVPTPCAAPTFGLEPGSCVYTFVSADVEEWIQVVYGVVSRVSGFSPTVGDSQ